MSYTTTSVSNCIASLNKALSFRLSKYLLSVLQLLRKNNNENKNAQKIVLLQNLIIVQIYCFLLRFK